MVEALNRDTRARLFMGIPRGRRCEVVRRRASRDLAVRQSIIVLAASDKTAVARDGFRLLALGFARRRRILLLVWDEEVVLGLGRRVQGALERHRVVSPSSRVLCRSLGCPQLAALCDYLGKSGLGVAGTACEPVQGSFGWKIIGNGAAAVALPGAFLVCLWAGRARLAVTAKARVRSSLGSSTRRMAFKNRLGVILREVETRTLASHGHPQ